MEFEDLTEEQKEKMAACKTTDDIFKLAREEGIDLTDADLEAIAGGWSALEGEPDVHKFLHF